MIKNKKIEIHKFEYTDINGKIYKGHYEINRGTDNIRVSINGKSDITSLSGSDPKLVADMIAFDLTRSSKKRIKP